MSLVSNTGPLIALAKIDKLSLLEQLFTEVYIPSTVHRELLAKGGPEANRLDYAFANFIHIRPELHLPPEVKVATSRIDLGEQQAITLAYEVKQLLLLDDRLGRLAAQQLNLAVTGTVGVLIQAKESGLVSTVGPLLHKIRQNGYWLSDRLIEAAIKLAGEG